MADIDRAGTERIEGIAAPLDIANLDTDQIMPKQFLRGIDKAGLGRGLLPPADALELMEAAKAAPRAAAPLRVAINVQASTVGWSGQTRSFALSARHRTMLLEGLDVIGASLAHRSEIAAFAQRHWAQQPWVRDIARRTKERLDRR